MVNTEEESSEPSQYGICVRLYAGYIFLSRVPSLVDMTNVGIRLSRKMKNGYVRNAIVKINEISLPISVVTCLFDSSCGFCTKSRYASHQGSNVMIALK